MVSGNENYKVVNTLERGFEKVEKKPDEGEIHVRSSDVSIVVRNDEKEVLEIVVVRGLGFDESL